MFSNALEMIRAFFRIAGLATCTPFHRDPLFVLALLAGIVVALGIRWLVAPQDGLVVLPSWLWVIMLVIVWPVVEEIVFRGLLQGELRATKWGRRQWLGISAANLLTCATFTALHFINQPPLWALSVFVPSLVFGFFRDRHQSLYPSVVLHASYNLFYFVAIL